MTLKNNLLAATLGSYTPAGPVGNVTNNYSLQYLEPVFANSWPMVYTENMLTTPRNAQVSRDGRYVFIFDSGSNIDSVEQWELKYPWAMPTMANTTFIANVRFSPSLGLAQGTAVSFTPWYSTHIADNGEHWYAFDDAYDRLWQWDLGTPWNISTMVRAGSGTDLDWKYSPWHGANSFLGAQSIDGGSICWNKDGTRLYMFLGTGDTVAPHKAKKIFTFTPESPWQVANIRFDGRHHFPLFETVGDYNGPYDAGSLRMTGNAQSWKWYWPRTTTRDYVTMMEMPAGENAFDYLVDFATTSSCTDLQLNTVDTTTTSAWIKPDLTVMITTGAANGNIAVWNIPATGNLQQYSLAGERNFIRANSQLARAFSPSSTAATWVTENGEYLIALHNGVHAPGYESGDRVTIHKMSTAWDPTTAEWMGRNTYPRAYVNAQDGTNTGDTIPTSFAWGDSGKTLLVQGSSLDWVFQFENLALPYRLGWIRYVRRFQTSAQDLNAQSIRWKSDGTSFYFMGNSGDDINQYNMSVAWDISTASFSTSFSISANESNPFGLWFKDDGTKVFYCGDVSDRVWQRTLSTAWTISSTSSTATSFLVSAQETAPKSIAIVDSGTKMYVNGTAGNDINRYNLGTAWDVTTATYQSIWGNATTIGSATRNFEFDDTGEHLFVLNATNQYIDRYKLNTPWVVAAAGTADAPLFSYYGNTRQGVGYYMMFGTQTGCRGLVVKDDGTEFIFASISTSTAGSMRQYSLANAWDFNSVTVGNIRFNNQVIASSVGPGTTIGCNSLNISSDGTNLYWQDQTTDYTVWRIPLNTAWDLSSANPGGIYGACTMVGPGNIHYGPGYYYLGNNPLIASASVAQIAVSDDETKIYVYGLNATGIPTVVQVNLSSAGNLETVTSVVTSNVHEKMPSEAITKGYFMTSQTGFGVSNDGNVFYIHSPADWIIKLNAATPWDFSSVARANANAGVGYTNFDGSGSVFQLYDLSADGQYFFSINTTGAVVEQWFLSTPFDFNSKTYLRATSTLPQGSISDLRIHPDGTSWYTLSFTQDNVCQRSGMTVAWNLDTFTALGNLRVNAQTTNPYGMDFKPDGTKLYVLEGTGTNFMYRYDLSTAWDVTTGSHDASSFDFGLLSGDEFYGISDIYNFRWNNTGTKFFFSTAGSVDRVWEYDNGVSAWDLPTSSGQVTFVETLYTGGENQIAPYATITNNRQNSAGSSMRETSLGLPLWNSNGSRLWLGGSTSMIMWEFKST